MNALKGANFPKLRVIVFVIGSYLCVLSAEKPNEAALVPIGSWSWDVDSQLTEFNWDWNHLLFLQSENGWSPAYSQNGKFKLIRTHLPFPEGDDMAELTIYDSLNNQIFKGTVGGEAAMSNDGVHFVSRFFTGGAFFFHSIFENPPKFDKAAGEHYYGYAFSTDGRYFAGAGDQRIELYTSDGTRIWGKLTNADSPKKVRISEDGSAIVMGTMSTSLGSGAVPAVGDKRVRDNRWTGKDHAIFITALDGSGSVLSQVPLEHPVIYEMELSNGASEQVAVSYLNFLTILDTRLGTIKWKQTFNKPLGIITSIAFSPDNRLIAVAGNSDGNTNTAKRWCYLLDIQGERMDSVIIEDSYRMSRIGPEVKFSLNGKHLLVASPTKKHLFKLTR